MARSDREIELFITSNDKTHPEVSVNVLISSIQAVQNLMYIMGDHLEGHQARTAGDFPRSVKENCELAISGLEMGSAAITMRILHDQYGLPGAGGTYGERAISLVGTIIDIASNQDEILPEVIELLQSDEHRAIRSVQEVENLWPDEGSAYDVALRFGSSGTIRLDRTRKPMIKNALMRSPEPAEKTISGRMVELSVDRKRQFVLDTPEGKYTCRYPPELEESVIRRIKQLVSISGSIGAASRTINIESEIAFKPLESLPLTHIRLDGDLRRLRYPVDLEVEFEDGEYILYNNEFNLLVVSDNLKDGVERITDELRLLWLDYVGEEETNLTEGGVAFRNKLRSLLGEAI
ncbi:hypothetical protein DSECCO2_468810 [anaerobic digester metagenome]